jgi:hypothetical protein
MSAAPTAKMLVRATPHLAVMGVSLFWMYSTLGWRVRKTRKAFEKQLILEGMSRKDARKVSACFSELKNNLTSMLRRGVTSSFSRE